MGSDTLFELELPQEYIKLGDRILETSTVIFIMHILIHLTPTPENGLFGPSFWRVLLFAFIGFFAYYLVIQRVLKFVPLSMEAASTTTATNIIQKFRTWLKDRL